MEREELEKFDCVIKTVGSLPLLRDFVARMGFADLRHALSPGRAG